MNELHHAGLVVRACAFATDAHHGQRRRYTGAPYIEHCGAVARLVSDHGGTQEMVAAAWLHDVIEDTAVRLDEIRQRFGEKVADMVWLLTDGTVACTGNRAARKKIDRDRLAGAPPAVQTIKLADLIDNADSIVRFDPSFAKVYMAEKAALLEVMTSGAPELHARALAIVQRYQTERV